MDDTHWKKVCSAVDVLYDNFTVRMNKIIPSMTEGEMQIACLIKLRIPVGDMAVLLGISPASVSQRKQRLKARILQSNGKMAEDLLTLDSWIMEL